MSNDPNDVERFRAIYSAHYDDLWKYCLRRTNTPAEAEDTLGDVFTVAWRQVSSVPDEPDTRPWLFGIARNHLRNTWRRTARSRELHLRLVSDAEVRASATAGPDLDDSSTEILDALHSLSEPDAELLRLVAWEQLPHREIAALLDCSENAVAIRIHRARQRLVEQLGHVSQHQPTSAPQEGDNS